MTVLTAAALVLTAAGLCAGLAVAAAGRHPLLALTVALELWLAAGLLRLADQRSWRAIATAAAIVAMRKLLTTTFALARARRGA